MKRQLAYICSSQRGTVWEYTQKAREYCREVYEAGYIPICPHIFFPQFLRASVPEENKDGTEMACQLLRRCHVLIVCENEISFSMMNEIALAERLNITATTLEGILTVKTQGRKPREDQVTEV
jgi:hypothetical protein